MPLIKKVRLTVCVNYYENIPVVCVPPLVNRTCFSGHHHMSLQEGPQVNKFDQVYSVAHQISVAGPRSDVHGGALPCGLSYDAFDVTYTYPLSVWTNSSLWKHNLPATSFASGKYSIIHLLSCLLPSNGCPQVSHLKGCTFSCCLATCLFSDDPVVNDISQLSTGHLYGRSPTSQMLKFTFFISWEKLQIVSRYQDFFSHLEGF